MAMVTQRAVNIWTKQKLDVRFASSRSSLQKSIAITSNPGLAAKGASLGVLLSDPKRTSVPFLPDECFFRFVRSSGRFLWEIRTLYLPGSSFSRIVSLLKDSERPASSSTVVLPTSVMARLQPLQQQLARSFELFIDASLVQLRHN